MTPRRVVIVNDCTDANARLRIESKVATLFPGIHCSFYQAAPFATLALSFLLSEGEFGAEDLVLFNAAPRNAPTQVTDNRGGEMVFLELKSGAVLVGPNEGYSLTLIKDQIKAIYTKKGDDGNKSGTQFRSAYVFPKAASEFFKIPPGTRENEYIKHSFDAWPFQKLEKNQIAWIDSFSNIKLTSTETLEPNKEYMIRFIRNAKLVGELRAPYRERLTNLAPGELGIITGSSFAQHGLEIARRTGQVGMLGAVDYLQEEKHFRLMVEDEVQLS